MRTLKTEFDLWLQTPLLEVLLWAVIVFGTASTGRALLGTEWLSSRYVRITFDLFAVTVSLCIMLGSLFSRRHWRRMHLGALGAITGDQLSALIVDLAHYNAPELYLLTVAAASALTGAVLMLLAYRSRGTLLPEPVRLRTDMIDGR